MKFLILIILFFTIIFILVPSIILSLIRFLLNIFGRSQSSFRNTNNNQNEQRNNKKYSTFHTTETTESNKKKVFDKNEGEYVNFEEIDKPSQDK